MFTYEMRPSRITAWPFRTCLGSDPGHGPAGGRWSDRSGSGSRGHPLEERHQVPVAVERRELARAEVRLRDAVLRDRVEHVAAPELVVQLVDALGGDAAAGCSGDERLRTGPHRLLQR